MPELASEVCRHLAVDLSTTTIRRFSNDCLYVQLNANCRERDVFVIQPLVPPVQEHLMELLLMLDAARGASAARTTAVIPYYAYARSDKKDAPRIAIAARLVADLLVTAGAKRVLTMTLACPQGAWLLQCADGSPERAKRAGRALPRPRSPQYRRGRPRSGACQSSHPVCPALECANGGRQQAADQRRTVRVEAIVGDVDRKDVIVMDDEIATGGTIMEVLHHLRARQVGRVAIACTHGIFTGPAIDRLRAVPEIAEIVTTNTVPLHPEQRLPNMHTLSIAPLLAEAIRRIHDGESVSSLFAEGA